MKSIFMRSSVIMLNRIGTVPYLKSICFGLIVFVLSWERLYIGGLIPVDGNMITMSYPNWSYLNGMVSKLSVPFWNPFRNMGEPFLADPQAMVLYPIRLMLSPITDFKIFLQVWVFFHSLIAGLFMWLLVRHLLKDNISALFAAILISCNGFFTARAIFPNHFAAASWLPAILYFQIIYSPIGLGVVLACGWLAGFPPIYILCCLGVTIVAAFQGKRGLLCLIKGAVIALGLVSVQIIPFLEFMINSTRNTILNSSVANQYALTIPQLLKEIFVPQWYGIDPVVNGDIAIMCFYVGVVPIALAIYAAIKGDVLEKGIACVIVCTLALSLGERFPWYDRVPFFHIFRFPANWLLLSTMGIVFLSAVGIREIAKSSVIRIVLIGIVTVDLLAFSLYRRSAWAMQELLSEKPPLAQMLQKEGMQRVYHTDFLMDTWETGALKERNDYLLMKEFLVPSYGMSFAVADINSYQVLKLRRAHQYLERLNAEGPLSNLLQKAGASTVITLKTGAKDVARNNMVVLRNNHSRGRVYLAQGTGSVEVTRYFPGRVNAQVIADMPTRVVFSEIYYPGWKATVDGKKAEIHSFEDTFNSVNVESGRHEITFRFFPISFLVGLMITMLTVIGIIWVKMGVFKIHL